MLSLHNLIERIARMSGLLLLSATALSAQVSYTYDLSGCLVARSNGLAATLPEFQLVENQYVGAQSNGLLSISIPVNSAGAVTYQWLLNGVPVPGATNEAFFLANASAANLGKYQLVASNAAGAVTSAVVNVSFFDPSGSGLPVAWELYYFGQTGVDPNADPNNDGVSNYGEYLDGTNPTNAGSISPRLNISATVGGNVSVTPLQLEYNLGESVQITAMPDPGMEFFGWVGSITNTNGTVTLTMNSTMTLTPVFGLPLAEVLDAPNLVWTTGGSAPWFGETNYSYDGVSAAQAYLTNNGEALLQTVLTQSNPVELAFRWTVSSASGSLSFSVNGTNVATLSGQPTNWTLQTFFLPSGTNTLLWTYSQPESDTSQTTPDSGWVDQVQVIPLTTTFGSTGVIAWGDNSSGQNNVPPGLTNAAAVAAGNLASVALTTQGTVLAWGTNYELNIPLGLSNIVAISSGGSHSLASTSQGAVVGWGDNTYGELNPPPGLNNVVAIAAGVNFSLALSSQGAVTGWGEDNYGQTNVPPQLTDAISIAAGDNHGLALTREATVIAWGDNASGQATVPAGLSNVMAIAAGGNFSLALTRQGTVVGWGDNTYGETNIPSGLTNVVAIAAGEEFGVALTSSGAVSAWGQNALGENDVPAGVTNVVAIAARLNHGLAVINGGSPLISTPPLNEQVYEGMNALLQVNAAGAPPLSYQWQFNGAPLAGATNAWLAISNAQTANAGAYRVLVTNLLGQVTTAPAALAIIDSKPIISIQPVNNSAFPGSTVVFSATVVGGQPLSYQWQFDQTNIAGATNALLTVSNLSAANVGSYRVVVSNAYGSAISSNAVYVPTSGAVVAWGDNTYGQTNVPAGLFQVTSISAGLYFNLALTSQGTVVAWGDNSEDELDVPPTLTNAVAIAAGGYTGLAITAGGLVVTWGGDLGGQLALPPGLTNVVGIAAGYYHSLALTSQGTVIAWGYDGDGQTNVPPGLTEVVAIASGDYHSLALTSQGTVVAWGENSSGQTNVPAGLSNVVAIAANGNFSMALTSSGKVVAWGDNSSKESTVPTSLTNAVGIAAAGSFGVGLTVTGSVVGWGTTTDAVIPPQVTNVLSLSAGQSHGIALVNSGALAIGRQPISQTIWGGQNALLNAGVESPLPLAYQWQFAGTNLPSATNASLLISNAQSSNNGLYSLVISNALGSVASSNAALTVISQAPEIIVQPLVETVPFDSTVTFSVLVTGGADVTYQWQFDQTNISGATNTALTLTNTSAPQVGNYRVIVSDSFGSTVSSNAPFVPVSTEVVAWGDNFDGETNVPAGLTNVVAVSEGEGECMALTSAGTIVTWGGQLFPPASLTNVAAIASGNSLAMAITSNGAVAVWGDNSFGETNIPPNLTDAVAIALGQEFCLAAKSDGTVVAWGDDSSGQTNVPAGLTNVIAVSAGLFHSLALKRDGTVVGWGDNSVGEIDIPAGLSNVVAISAGDSHSMALTANGNVFVWGDDDSGQTNIPSGLSNVVAISAGGYFCTAIVNGGVVVAWGDNSYGQLNIPPGLTNVAALAGGEYNVLAIVNSGAPFISGLAPAVSAYTGANFSLQATVVGIQPISLQWQLDGTNISGATNLQLTITNAMTTEAGLYRVVANNSKGQSISSPVLVTVVNSPPIIIDQPAGDNPPFGSSATFDAFITGSGPLTYQWQLNQTNITGATNAILTLTNISAANGGAYRVVVSNAFGVTISSNAIVLPVSSQVVAWGDNSEGEIDVPPGLVDVIAVAGGEFDSIALTSQGTVVGWGSEDTGVIEPPANLTNATAISAGEDFDLALTATGEVFSWGDNSVGEAYLPAGLANVASISAGELFGLALTTNGQVFAWGDNSYRERNISASVTNLGAIAISAGFEDGLALLDNNTVAAWGNNSAGQLNIPPGLSNVVAIAAGGLHNLALLANGTVVAWGYNYYGQTNVPPGLTNVAAIAAGEYFSLALTTQGTVVAWGDNTYGETTLPASLVNVTGIACGWIHALAILGGGSPVFCRQPADETIYSGMTALLSAGVTGDSVLNYQWQFDGTNIPHATQSFLVITNAQVANSGTYNLVAANALGSVSSSGAVLTVSSSSALQFVVEPQSQTGTIGASVVFSATPAGDPPSPQQSHKNGSPITGATTNSLTLSNLQNTNAASYTVVVTNAFGSITSSNAVLTVVTGPVNDLFANRIALTGLTNTATGSSVYATRQTGEPMIANNPGGSSVWWSWTAPSNGIVTINTFGSSFDTLLGVYTGTSVSALTLAASDDDYGDLLASLVTFAATQGVTYQIAVDGYDGASGNVTLNIQETPPGPPTITTQPLGQTVTLGGFVAFTVAATGIGPFGYQWQANALPIAGATTALLSFDNLQASNAASYTVVLTNAYGAVTSSVAALTLVAGPPNDAFANRLTIPAAGGTLTGSNQFATKEPGEPDIDGNAGGSSVWWTWTAPANGTVTLNTAGSSFDTLMGVFTGGSVSNLAWVAGDSDGAAVTFPATSGTAYQVVVDGYNGATGSIVLTLQQNKTSTLLNAAIQGRQLTFSINATIGVTYTLQYVNALPGNWIVLTNITAASTNVVFQDSLTNSTSRFYRLMISGN